MDLERVFQKLDGQHKAKPARPAKSPFFAEQAGIHSKRYANPWLWACGLAWLVVFGVGIYLGVQP